MYGSPWSLPFFACSRTSIYRADSRIDTLRYSTPLGWAAAGRKRWPPVSNKDASCRCGRVYYYACVRFECSRVWLTFSKCQLPWPWVNAFAVLEASSVGRYHPINQLYTFLNGSGQTTLSGACTAWLVTGQLSILGGWLCLLCHIQILFISPICNDSSYWRG